MKQYRVRITEDVERDLVDIFRYVETQDSADKAAHVLDQLESLCLHLSELPLRGHVPPELERIGISNFREVHFKPYRVIYEVIGQQVFVHAILDGRRDMQALLERRLLR